MKRLVCGVLLLGMLLGGCVQQRALQYSCTYYTLFDTVTTVVGKADSEAEFEETAQGIHDALWEYHQLFDIYRDYDGINNLKTINDAAGIAPVSVDGRIIQLLLRCKEYYTMTGGKVNAAMGSVLQLWHAAREDARKAPETAATPDAQALKQAAEHTNFDAVIIDEAASTVYISDPSVRLDVGATAKGWATQQVAQTAPAGLLISVGGNVCATGPKDASGTAWVVGVQNPDGGGFVETLRITGGSVVTSGDYQRSYVVDGKQYHHIIDPDTLYPGEYWRSVTVICSDSGLADALSTALFLLPLEEGQALLHSCEALAMWVDAYGNVFHSPGFEMQTGT